MSSINTILQCIFLKKQYVFVLFRLFKIPNLTTVFGNAESSLTLQMFDNPNSHNQHFIDFLGIYKSSIFSCFVLSATRI